MMCTYIVQVMLFTFFAAAVNGQPKPNILFLMTDSMDGRVVDPRAPEFEIVDMPFLKGVLAKNGANFVNSYSNNPMCVPSRTSMMTGRRSDKINVWGNEQGLAASPTGILDDMCVLRLGKEACKQYAEEQGYPKTILSVFKDLGYNVHMDGRLHIGAGMLNPDQNADQVHGMATCQAFDDTRAGEVTRSADIRHAPGAIFQETFLDGAKEDAADDSNFGISDWQAVRRCNEWIQTLPSPSQSTQPFFLHCSLNLPHYSFSTNSTWLAAVHEDRIKLPTWKAGFPDLWHPYDSFMSIAKAVGGEFAKEDIRKLQRVYYGMVAESDAMLLSVWNTLTQKGYSLDNTYVIYVSDHGELKFEHRQVYKASMYEGSVRVPMQIAGPGVAKGAVRDHVVSLLDVFPTLLDMAEQSDTDAYQHLNGKSLLLAAGAESAAPVSMRLDIEDNRDFVLSQYNWVEANTGVFMVRSGPWKYMTYGHTYKAYKDYKPQLYNVENDPEELDDIASENSDVITDLDKKLRQHIDPDEVDRNVMRDDFIRLQSRFAKEPQFLSEANTNEMLKLVARDYHDQFKDWLHEAYDLFGTATATPVSTRRLHR